MLNSKALLVAVMVVFLILSISQASALNTFERVTWGSTTGATVQPITQLVYDVSDCSLDIRSYFTGTTSTPYYINFQYYAPIGNSQVIGTTPLVSNVTCLPLGGKSGITENNNSLFETEMDITHGATISHTTYEKSILTCSTDDFYVTVGVDGNLDANGYSPNVFRTDVSGVYSGGWASYKYNIISNNVLPFGEVFTDMLESDENGVCPTSTYSPSYSGNSWNHGGDFTYRCAIEFLPFYSGETGEANIKVSPPIASQTDGGVFKECSSSEIGYYNNDNAEGSNQSLISGFDDGNNGWAFTSVNENVTITPKKYYTLYMMYCSVYTSGGTGTTFTFYNSNANVTYPVYNPDWNCTEWSVCESGIRSKVCNDLNGIAIDKIEFESCSTVILENVSLGFEEYTEITDVLRCDPTWNIWGCGYTSTPDEKTIRRPTGWTVVENANLKQYFLEMTNEWATEGSLSLKMWFIPPKDGEPLSNTTCGNLTNGVIPSIFQGVNDSTFLSYNVTFPATNMEVTFDVKKCDNQQRQYYELLSCPEVCYANNCSTEPLGRYYFNIIDTNTSQSLLGTPFFDNAVKDTKTPQFDLSDLGIVVNRTYNIVFAVYPENVQDTRGDCVMFDNVDYNVLEVTTLDLLGGCSSQCIGNDWYDATLQTNGNCRTIKFENDDRCLPSTIGEKRVARENYCEGDTTLWFYDNFTAKYISTECEYRCVDGTCVTEDEYNEIIATEATTSAQTGEVLIDGISALFATPAFLSILIASILGGLVVFKLKSEIMGLVSFLGVLGVLSFLPVLPNNATLFPSWFFIVLVVVSGAIYAYLFRSGAVKK